MSQPGYSDQVGGLALDIAWSLWAELGVSGWSRRHGRTAVDLESLLIATPMLCRGEARLRDETLDWCVANHRFVSAVRVRNLLKSAGDDVRDAFGDFSMTLKQHVRAPWPGEGNVQPFVPRGRSSTPELTRPALIQLRLRAIVGVSVRAEILRLLLGEPMRMFSAAELASAVAYGKGMAAAALELLASAGIVETHTSGNQFRYRLGRRTHLISLLEPLPLHFPDWPARFRIIHAILRFAETAPRDGMPRAVEARRTIRSLEPDLRLLGFGDSLGRSGSGEALASEFEQWSLAVLKDWSGDDGLVRRAAVSQRRAAKR